MATHLLLGTVEKIHWEEVFAFSQTKQNKNKKTKQNKKNLAYQTIDLSKYCCEKVLEICAVRYQLKSLKLIIFCVYRAPSCNLKQFYV